MGKYCPPCINCAFPAQSRSFKDTSIARILVTKTEYGCVRKDGGSLIETDDGQVGLLRSSGFHQLTEAGADFHRTQQESPLAAYI